jgi:hypothetical protein
MNFRPAGRARILIQRARLFGFNMQCCLGCMTGDAEQQLTRAPQDKAVNAVAGFYFVEESGSRSRIRTAIPADAEGRGRHPHSI